MKKFKLEPEIMCGKTYYMIYKKLIFGCRFYERWNTEKSASKRLEELLKK